jgi:AraC-like DNA-binding protein
MPFIPLPFLVAVLLLILLAQIARADDDAPANRPFLALIAACAVQSTLLGLRWGYGIEPVRYVLPIVATTVPPLVYASFGGLAQNDPAQGRAGVWLHGLPPILVAVLVLLWPGLLDLAIIVIFLGYAVALLRLARRGPDGLGLARLEGAMPAYRALQVAAAALTGSAVIDVIVLLDFEWTRGAHAAAVVSIANLLSLGMLGLAAVVAGRTRPPAETTEPALAMPQPESGDDGEVVGKIDELMRKQALFRDPNLNLSRLARKAGIPARRISVAVNRLHAKNVSQYINGYRITETCRLLSETSEPVTRIMLDAGFQTKSNFNREFRRVTGMSPKIWRTSNAKAGAGVIPVRQG